MVLDDLLLAINRKNIMNVAEDLFNPLSLYKTEKERNREDRKSCSLAVFFPSVQSFFLSHDAAVNLVSRPRLHSSAHSAAGRWHFCNIFYKNIVKYINSVLVLPGNKP